MPNFFRDKPAPTGEALFQLSQQVGGFDVYRDLSPGRKELAKPPSTPVQLHPPIITTRHTREVAPRPHALLSDKDLDTEIEKNERIADGMVSATFFQTMAARRKISSLITEKHYRREQPPSCSFTRIP